MIYQDEERAIGVNGRNVGPCIHHLKLLDFLNLARAPWYWLISWLDSRYPNTSTVPRLVKADCLFPEEAFFNALIIADRLNFIGIHHVWEGEFTPFLLTLELLSPVKLAVMLRYVKDLFFSIIEWARVIHLHFLEYWAVITIPQGIFRAQLWWIFPTGFAELQFSLISTPYSLLKKIVISPDLFILFI